MKKKIRNTNSLKKLGRKEFRGYPIATIAYYGPDNQHATKVAVGIVEFENSEPSLLERWYSETTDIRFKPEINEEITHFIKQNNTKSVVIADRIMGCPHEEGKDYPEGSVCPKCPFWANRDRFTGEIIQ